MSPSDTSDKEIKNPKLFVQVKGISMVSTAIELIFYRNLRHDLRYHNLAFRKGGINDGLHFFPE